MDEEGERGGGGDSDQEGGEGWMGMRTMVVPGLCSGTAVLGGVNEKDGEGSIGD